MSDLVTPELQSAEHQRLTRSLMLIQASYRGVLRPRPASLGHSLGNWYMPVGAESIYDGVIGDERASNAVRARRVARLNPLAKHILDCNARRVVGNRPKLRAATSLDSFDVQADRAFADATRGTRMDAMRRKTFGQIMRRARYLRSRDGDALLVMMDRGGFPALQIVPEYAIKNPSGSNQLAIQDGIILRADGRTDGYYVAQDQSTRRDFARINQQDGIFIRRPPEDEAVVRGESAFTGTFSLFDHIGGLFEALVVAMRVAASASIVEEDNHTGSDHPDETRVSADGSGAVYDAPPQMEMTPGAVLWGRPGKTYKQIDPKHPSQNAMDAVQLFIRIVALKFGVSLADALLDFSGLNYSVSRSLRIHLNELDAIEAEDDAQTLLYPIWRWTIAKAIQRGDIVGEIPQDWDAHVFTPHRAPVADERQHMQAMAVKLELGLISMSEIVEAEGRDFAETIRRQVADAEFRRGVGLEPSPGIESSTPTATDPEDEDEDDA